MTIQHKDIPEVDLHQTKGISTAAVNTTQVADGVGGGVWKKVPVQGLNGLPSNGVVGQILAVDGTGAFTFTSTAHGSVNFINITTPYTLTYPSAYTKVAPTTAAGGDPNEFTEATNARLTYTGLNDKHCRLLASISCDQSSGSNRDLQFAFFKNGGLLPGSEVITTTQSGVKVNLGMIYDEVLTQNDYIEVFAKNNGGSGDIKHYTFYISVFSFHKES